MSDEGLISLITSYIENRKQAKLEDFDKEAKKRISALNDAEQIAVTELEIAQQRRELEQKFEIRHWLSDAAIRAKQINLVTHAIKFTHSDAKGSSVFLATTGADSPYLSTATLRHPAIDAVGNAAALDVAKLLQMEHQSGSLIAHLHRGDFSPLAALAESEQQLQQWVSGFLEVFADKHPASHKRAKQLYFPVAENAYHLLSPLFSSSLTHAMHQRLSDARFSEAAKEINTAVKNGKWHPASKISYRNTAVQTMGGTKPQNVSYLNSVRGGRTWLLSCAPPSWKTQPKPPAKHKSIFHEHSEFSFAARVEIAEMREYLLSVQQLSNTVEIRQRRLAHTDKIIDALFNYVAGIQQLAVQPGWSGQADCLLKRSQQLWLDPGRAASDTAFRSEREHGGWQNEIATDFGLWLNRRLQHEKMKFAEVERREWSSLPLFKQRLREFEQLWGESAA